MQPKVAHVTTIDLSLRLLLLDQMCAIRDAGFEVVAISAPGSNTDALEAAGIRHIAVPMTRRATPWSDLRALLKLVAVFRREKFDIVHTHTPKAALLGQYAALLAGVPVRVHTIHGLYLPTNPRSRMKWFFAALERITMRFSHLNLSQNPEDVSAAISEKISTRERIELLGNGIDISKFQPSLYSADRRESIRRTLGLSADRKVVGIVGRFCRQKGYHDLIEAVQTVRRDVRNVQFLFIGPVDQERRDALDPGLISARGLDDVVTYLGHRDDIADLCAVMDVFTLPSYREGLPRAAMEAAAMGVPAVVTDIRGCRQTVDHDVNGYLVPVGNPSALATALIDLLCDDEKRYRFGEAARRKAVREFDQKLVFARVIAAYNRLLGAMT